MNNKKIALGTVQFGLDYGISNNTGIVSEQEVSKILDIASLNGIEILDTATAYGTSEKVLGSNDLSSKFKIISKIPADTDSYIKLLNYFKQSISNLNVNSLYAYMFHDFNTFIKHPELLEHIQKLKSNNKIQKVGFSLYSPSQLEYLLTNNISFDIVQLPYNILDRRFEPFFSLLKEKGIEIHVRSVFLQGIFFLDQTSIFKKLGQEFKEIVLIQEFAKQQQIELHQLLLAFALCNQYIDHVVIGVASPQNLLDNINLDLLDQQVIEHCLQFASTNEQLLLPFNWKN